MSYQLPKNRLFVAGSIAGGIGVLDDTVVAFNNVFTIKPTSFLVGKWKAGVRLNNSLKLYSSVSYGSFSSDVDVVVSNVNFKVARKAVAYGLGIDLAPAKQRWGIDLQLFDIYDQDTITSSLVVSYRF